MRRTLASAAILLTAATCLPAQITLTNTATGGPATATTVGTAHSLDTMSFRIGTQSCAHAGTASNYMPTAAALNPATSGNGGPGARAGFTIQWWQKVTQPTQFGYHWGEVGWSSFRCFQNGAAGTGNMIVRGPLTDLATTGAPLQNSLDPNGWIHFAVVVDSGANTTTWYVNGQPNATGMANITGSGTNFNALGYTSSCVPGNYDDFRIYDWARAAGDIAADFQSPAVGAGPSGSPNTPDLGYYQCEPPTQLVLSGAPRPGSTVDLDMVSSASAGLTYQVGSSFSSGPIQIAGRQLGLGLDDLLVISVRGVLPSIFSNYAGAMSAQGRANAKLNIPNITALIGVRIYNAFLTLDPQSPGGVKAISGTQFFSITT